MQNIVHQGDWSLPTPLSIKNIVTEIRKRGMSPQQQTNVAMFKLIARGGGLVKTNPIIGYDSFAFYN
ncbi:hypothetical protein BGS_1376 [Beggiatoa sp. SS]|nr:hypothetical protein BGS_1376 [Beggiatoa sp. SS]